jgi:hypothetical protein
MSVWCEEKSPDRWLLLQEQETVDLSLDGR